MLDFKWHLLPKMNRTKAINKIENVNVVFISKIQPLYALLHHSTIGAVCQSIFSFQYIFSI